MSRINSKYVVTHWGKIAKNLEKIIHFYRTKYKQNMTVQF